MNANKAREFFSSYFEGNLDDGLRQAFERTLNTDAELQAEYKAFERTLGQLAGLRDVEIEVPFDLHERISARLDRHIYEKRQTRGGGFLAFWKPALAAGVASLAVIGTVLSLNSSGGDVQGAAVIGGGGTLPGPSSKGYRIEIQPADSDRTIRVLNALTGAENIALRVGKGEASSLELSNSGAKAELSKIEIPGNAEQMFVAVPGRTALSGAGTDATLRGAALRLAARLRLPVVLLVKDPARALPVVNPQSREPVAAASEMFGSDLAIELRADGFLWVQEH